MGLQVEEEQYELTKSIIIKGMLTKEEVEDAINQLENMIFLGHWDEVPF